MSTGSKRLPEWLRKKISVNQNVKETKKILKQYGLNSVCQSAKCPNRGECFSNKTATFMIMGNICTRDCRFCAVPTGDAEPLQEEEPVNIAHAVEELGLKHVVITSVTRDDLEDGGAEHFVKTINEIRKINPETIIEVLTPDFENDRNAIERVIEAKPDIFNHNVETIPELYKKVRPQAKYKRSLSVLKYVDELVEKIFTKSGIMVGLGETVEQVTDVMKDLREVNCDILTIGQYLQPGKEYLPVDEYIKPEQFEKYQEIAENLGFIYVASGPFVRSSFHAKEFSQIYMKEKYEADSKGVNR